jgi:hypothetical protein
VIDAIVPEPKGGAHRDWNEAFKLMRENLIKHMKPLLADWNGSAKDAPNGAANGTGKKKASKAGPKAATPATAKALIAGRMEKFRAMGQMALASAPVASGSGAEE